MKLEGTNNMISLTDKHYTANPSVEIEYDEKIDIWAIGVITHIMVIGWPPYDGDSPNQIKNAIVNNKLDFD